MLTVIAFIIVLSLLVFAHELGHFWVARKMGITPKEFGFGLPPRLWGIYKDKNGKWKSKFGKGDVPEAADTIYSLNWIPLGGFVNLEEDKEGGDDKNHFSNKLPWQRACILAAGVTMNLILAVILFSIGYMIGMPQAIEGAGPHAKISNEHIQIIEVMPDSPAQKAGLEAGDTILAVNGADFTGVEDLQKYTQEHVDQNLTYIIQRGGEKFSKEITPTQSKETQKGGIGVAIVETGIVRYPIYLSIWYGIKTTVLMTIGIIFAFYQLIKNLILGNPLGGQIGGPVEIARLAGQHAHMGFAYLLRFTAVLSINLAILNALPFPALDGGRLLFLAIEKIKGSPVKKEIEGTIHYIGFALLIILVIFITFKDISRLGS